MVEHNFIIITSSGKIQLIRNNSLRDAVRAVFATIDNQVIRQYRMLMSENDFQDILSWNKDGT